MHPTTLRKVSSFLLSLATFAVTFTADTADADAQLFRRLQERRQSRFAPSPAPARRPSNYGQPNVRPNSQPNLRQRVPAAQAPFPSVKLRTGQSRPEGNRLNPNSATVSRLPSANYSKVPTPAAAPQTVPDNLDDGSSDGSATKASSASGPAAKLKTDDDLGQSILTRAKSPDGAGEKSARSNGSSKKKSADESDQGPNTDAKVRPKSATMGLSVYQRPVSRDGVEPSDGVVIARIEPGSRATESGLRVGDKIVALDRNRTRSVQDIAALLRARKPGQTVQVHFIRGRNTYSAKVPLVVSNIKPSNKPSNKRSNKRSNKPSNKRSKPNRVTVAKQPVSSAKSNVAQASAKEVDNSPTAKIKLGMMIDDSRSLRGTIVTSVRPGSIANASGMQTGDRIVSADGNLLRNGDGLRRILATKVEGDTLAMGIVRGGVLMTRKVVLSAPVAGDIAGPIANPQNTNKSKAAVSVEKESSSGLAKGIGSMLGGLFAGNKGNQSDAANSPPGVLSEEPSEVSGPKKSSANTAGSMMPTEIDPLEFGDDEPVEQVIFEKVQKKPSVNDSSRNGASPAQRNSQVLTTVDFISDPPSISSLVPPAGNITQMMKSDSLKQADVRKLRDQINRLKLELQAIEGPTSNELTPELTAKGAASE